MTLTVKVFEPLTRVPDAAQDIDQYYSGISEGIEAYGY